MAPQAPGLTAMLADGIRARGSFHRLNHDVAVRHAARPTHDIVAELRMHADSRRLSAVTYYRNILFDVLVHTQDIAIPLDRDYPMPSEAARAGASRVWTMGWPFCPPPLAACGGRHGNWFAGTGVELRDRSGCLVAVDRAYPTAVPHLSGPGVHDHRATCHPRPS
jgi:hypothetical protein